MALVYFGPIMGNEYVSIIMKLYNVVVILSIVVIGVALVTFDEMMETKKKAGLAPPNGLFWVNYIAVYHVAVIIALVSAGWFFTALLWTVLGVMVVSFAVMYHECTTNNSKEDADD